MLPLRSEGHIYVLQCRQGVMARLPCLVARHVDLGSCEEGLLHLPQLRPIEMILGKTVIDEQLATGLPHACHSSKLFASPRLSRSDTSNQTRKVM